MTTHHEDPLPFFIYKLPNSTLRKCEEELNEYPDRKVKALQELRSLLQRDQKTSGIDFHEDRLVQFLRRNKYRIRDAYQNLQNFVVISQNEGLFQSFPEVFLDLPSCKAVVLLSKRCPDGCTILQFQIGKWNPSEISFEHLQSLLCIVINQLIRDPMSQINGFKYIYDFKGTSISHLKCFSPQALHLFYHRAVNCLPGRHKEVHFVNNSIIVKVLWATVKPFLSNKIKNRVIFHSNPDELLNYFPPSVLPKEYGGTNIDEETKDWLRKANKYNEEFTIEGQPNFY